MYNSIEEIINEIYKDHGSISTELKQTIISDITGTIDWMDEQIQLGWTKDDLLTKINDWIRVYRDLLNQDYSNFQAFPVLKLNDIEYTNLTIEQGKFISLCNIKLLIDLRDWIKREYLDNVYFTDYLIHKQQHKQFKLDIDWLKNNPNYKHLLKIWKFGWGETLKYRINEYSEEIIIKFYTPEINLIVSGDDNLNVEIIETEEKTVIDGDLLYFDNYVQTFQKGQAYFKENFPPPIDLIYGKNAKEYVKTIQYHYFQKEIAIRNEKQIGWNFVRKKFPKEFDLRTIKEYGYYSGIVSSVDDLIEKYPILFKNYTIEQQSSNTDKTIKSQNSNIENIQPQQSASLKSIEDSENKFWKGYPMREVVEHFMVFVKQKNKNNEPYLTESQLISFLKRGFLDDLLEQKQTINYCQGEKGKVILRFYEFFYNAVSKGYKNTKQPFIDLFLNCFDGWTETEVKSSFRANRVKEHW